MQDDSNILCIYVSLGQIYLGWTTWNCHFVSQISAISCDTTQNTFVYTQIGRLSSRISLRRPWHVSQA